MVNSITDTPKKRCTKCKEWKDITEFNRDNHTKDGLRYHCVACRLLYRKTHQEAITAYRDTHKQEKAIYRATHKKDIAEYQAKYREAHKDELRAYRLSYYRSPHGNVMNRARNHRRRARKSEAVGKYTAAQLVSQGDCQRWRCWWCGKDCKDDYQVDHLIPISRGGHNDISNIVIACLACNASKRDRLPQEWCGRLL